MSIPPSFYGVALAAVASGDQRTLTATAVQLGVSVPALTQDVLLLVRDPRVVAAHPRPCRVIVERGERARAARDGRVLSVRSEV